MLVTNNLGDVYHAEVGGDGLALVDCLDWDRPKEYSHREIHERAGACARGLLARGLSAGARVGILSANRVEFLIAFLGALRAGLVAVPINHKFPREIIQFILEDAAIQWVLCDEPRRASVPNTFAVVSFDDAGPNGFDQLLDRGPFTTVSPAIDTVAMILYTSGSTGRPKGVPLTHAGHLWALQQRLAAGWPFTEHRLLVAAPLYHMNALCISLFALGGGASMVLLPQFDAKQYLLAIERFRCTWITSVPTMIALCFQASEVMESVDLSSVRIVRMGSAPISPKLLGQVKETFAGASVMNGYGTTEAGPVVFGAKAGQSPPDLSVGWVSSGVDVRLVDANGADTDQGELWQRTPATMGGYLNLPEKTAEVLTDDGWYLSGDVFRRDDDGAYYFVGRTDDMFNCGGENIYPGEVEAVLLTHPAIAQACVVAIPDEIKGHKPVAFVVCEWGATVSEAELKAHALRNAPAYQHPRKITFLAAMPLAGPGKVDRRRLSEQANAEAS